MNARTFRLNEAWCIVRNWEREYPDTLINPRTFILVMMKVFGVTFTTAKSYAEDLENGIRIDGKVRRIKHFQQGLKALVDK